MKWALADDYDLLVAGDRTTALHVRNFLDCVRSRALTIAPVEVAHRSASVGHLGVVAIHTGRTIKWDPATESIIGDPGAERLLSRAYRKPYQLPA